MRLAGTLNLAAVALSAFLACEGGPIEAPAQATGAGAPAPAIEETPISEPLTSQSSQHHLPPRHHLRPA